MHILNGPNDVALGLMLALGISITFVASLVIFGAARTQEQAFGIGSYLVAIISSITTAVYFKLTDE